MPLDIVGMVDHAGVGRAEHRLHELPGNHVRRMHGDAAVHADHLLCLFGNETNIMTHEANRDACCELTEKIMERTLDRGVEVRGGFVE